MTQVLAPALPLVLIGLTMALVFRRLLRLFVELNRLGTSIVLATHDTDLMAQFPARSLVLEDGRLRISE